MQRPALRAFASVLVALAPALAPARPLAAQQRAAVGLDVTGMDTTVRAGGDFYGYANGGWARATEIPADRSSVNAFAITNRRAREQRAEIDHSGTVGRRRNGA